MASASGRLTAPYRPAAPTLSASSTLIVVPDNAVSQEVGRYLRDGIGRTIGQRIPMVASRDFSSDAWASHDLVVLGNLNNCTAARDLYVHHHSFADRAYPGGDGYTVSTVADPFGSGHGCFMVAGSTDEGLAEAARVFVRMIAERGPRPGRLHAASSPLAQLAEPDTVALAQILRDSHAAFLSGTGVGSLHRAIEAGLLFGLTDRPIWGKLFRKILFDYMELAREHGTYAFEHMLFIYSWLWKLVLVWDLVEDSPLFSDDDRLAMGNCLWDLGRYLTTLPYWSETANPPGEPRQNHSTFAALSLFGVRTYLHKAYGLTELDYLLPAADQIMRGQSHSAKPNDDAGVGYVWIVPRHVGDYLLRQNDWSFLERDRLRALADLAIITTDNRRDECGYGDVGAYVPWEALPRPASLKILSMAAWYYHEGSYSWAYNWLGDGKDLDQAYSTERPRALGDFFDGLYASPTEPVFPAAYIGVRAVLLDEAAVGWVGHRIDQFGWSPEEGAAYVDKLSFRRDFDPASEYLCLEGPSTYAHGHQDGNSITRLTWRDRLWLADLDYIRFQPRYHNSLVVTRDGEDRGISPLTRLDNLIDLPSVGMTATTVTDYNGADWQRRIIWLKGRLFIVLDDVRARTDGEYRTQCLWRLLGQVELAGRTVTAQQAGECFSIVNGDGSLLDLQTEESPRSGWDRYPHADGTISVLRQQRRSHLTAGQSHFYVNLIHAGSTATPVHNSVIPIGARLSRVVTDGKTVVAGSPPDDEIGGIHISADTILVGPDVFTVMGCTAISAAATPIFSSNVPVSFEFSRETGDLTLVTTCAATVRFLAAEVFTEDAHLAIEVDHAVGHFVAGRHTLRVRKPGNWEALCRTILEAPEIEPLRQPDLAPVIEGTTPRMAVFWEHKTDAPVSAFWSEPSGAVAAGTAEGQILRYAADGPMNWVGQCRGAIRSIHGMDLDVDGRLEYAIGTDAAELALLAADGQTLWTIAFPSAHGRPQKVAAVCPADLDGKGKLTLLAATEGWRLSAINPDGRQQWWQWLKYHGATTCAAADLDGDGRAEVVVGNEYHTPINVFGPDGDLRWYTWEQVGSEARATTPRCGTHATSLLLADVDADGHPEIIYGTDDNWIYAVNAANGRVHWAANVGAGVADLAAVDGDQPGFAVATALGDLFLLDRSGRKRWRRPAGDVATQLAVIQSARSEPVIAVGTNAGKVLVYGLDGELLACQDGESAVTGLAAISGSPAVLWVARGRQVAGLRLPTT